MTLAIKTIEKKEHVYSVCLKGSLDTDTYQSLEKALKELIGDATKAVVLDMAGVDYVSSIGIRVVMWTKKTLEAGNATFAMIDLQPQVQKVFDIVKAIPIQSIFSSWAEVDAYLDTMQKQVLEGED